MLFNFAQFPKDVLYTICNNCGPVQRIVIFRKNGVQAMVEYPFLLSFGCLIPIRLTQLIFNVRDVSRMSVHSLTNTLCCKPTAVSVWEVSMTGL